MADDLNLEVDETPGPPAQAPAATPPPTPQADPDEAQAVEVPNAGKMVPLAALKAVREENKGLKAQTARLEQLEQYARDAQPYVDFIKQNPQLVQQRQQPQAPTADADPKLVKIAKSLDFYTTDGKPDLERARNHQALIREEAQEIANQVVQPVAMNTYSQAAQRNWQTAVQEKLPNGAAIDTNLLTIAWQGVQRVNPAALADPNTIRFIINNVMAEQMRANPTMYQQPAAPGRPPVVTENVGARPNASNRMNDTQRAIVAGRGIDDKKFGELTAGFNPGRMNVLEED